MNQSKYRTQQNIQLLFASNFNLASIYSHWGYEVNVYSYSQHPYTKTDHMIQSKYRTPLNIHLLFTSLPLISQTVITIT